MTENLTQWPGDVLGRKITGDFLHRYLVRKYEAHRTNDQAGAICFALDGAWGTGKSFFVRRWAKDIEGCQHPVILFDAWKNDLSEDPLMGFIGALRAGLKPWEAKLPVAKRAGKKLAGLRANIFQKAARAVIPVSSLLAKAAVKRLTALDIEELQAALDNPDSDSPTTEENKDSDGTAQLKSDVVDKIFEAAIEEQEKRNKAIEELKTSLGELLDLIAEKASANLPVFVFIDELDRCRPNFAIELLEGIKHLFDVRGLCFCISTNLEQLGESIKGAYGGNFDAYMYLKRFFSIEYALPEPDNHSFARLLVHNSQLLKREKIAYGLSSKPNNWSDDAVAETFHFVAQAFRLKLRSQQQVFDVAEAASTGIASDKSLHILFLFSLAALRHVDRSYYDKLVSDGMQREQAPMDKFIDSSVSHVYQTRRTDEEHRGERIAKKIGLKELLNIYLKLADQDLKDIRDQSNRRNSIEYPQSLERALVDEMPQSFYPDRNYTPSIAHYAVLIKTAGQLARGPGSA